MDESNTSLDRHNTTLFNESIFGPIHAKNHKRDNASLEPVEFETVELPFQGNCLQKTAKQPQTSKSSMFERMIQEFEATREKGKDSERKERMSVKEDKYTDVGEEDKLYLKNQEWKNFITGMSKATKPVCPFSYSVI